MLIIKLDAIDSTNSYLRQLSQDQKVDDFTVVTAKTQTKGRGQMGTLWNSQEAKNLTMSVYKDVSSVKTNKQFYISIVTSLAVVKALETFSIPKLRIKWPNDILSENKKICGILIENVIKQEQFSGSIIGIGLNVNQTQFSDLPSASSLQLILGKHFSTEEIMHRIIQSMKSYFKQLEAQEFKDLKQAYETYLFRKNKPSTFQDAKGQLFSGYIQSVSDQGNLCVLLEDEIVKEFDLKALKLLY